MDSLDARGHRNGMYRYDLAKGQWARTWTLNSLAKLTADFPMARTYISGHQKPSVVHASQG